MVTKKSIGEKIFDSGNIVFLIIVACVTVYPMVFILASSLSDYNAILRNDVFLFPKGFTLEGYADVFADGAIFKAYYNTLWYTFVGTFINLFFTLTAAYALSRKYYTLRSPITMIIAVTMFFSGGIIPSFLLINWLGLYDTRWAMVLPGAVSVFNLIMAREFLTLNIPDEMAEAAKIDGANDLYIFYKIVLPLCKPIIAVLALFYGVAHWNSFFNAMIYLNNPDYLPLSLYLRRLLVLGTTNFSSDAMMDPSLVNDPAAVLGITQRIKYASIMVTMLPILLSYPFFQKYFAKGVMIGSIKS